MSQRRATSATAHAVQTTPPRVAAMRGAALSRAWSRRVLPWCVLAAYMLGSASCVRVVVHGDPPRAAHAITTPRDAANHAHANHAHAVHADIAAATAPTANAAVPANADVGTERAAEMTTDTPPEVTAAGSAATPDASASAAGPGALRVATFNVSLNHDSAGGLIARLRRNDANARRIAAVLQRVRPDVVLLNEFDFDHAHVAADLFARNYLAVPQPDGGPALRYSHRFLAPVNTGVPSGLDLDGSGDIGGSGRARGNDAWGYGLHPGQYGMLLLSRYPIDADAVRTFQHLRWSSLPNATRPVTPRTATRHGDASSTTALSGRPFHSDAVWAQLRLSSKSHWDVPVRTPLGVVHMLAAHPTPPVFDGPEDRNGARNADEIRLWHAYLSSPHAPWLCDDAGRCGGLASDARFVILGDYNNDPTDGDGHHDAISALLQHPRVLRTPAPRSDGGAQVAQSHAAAGTTRRGDSATVTGDFGATVGALRLDYALPSVGFALSDSGVFWPRAGEDGSALGAASDHHLVWVDLRNPTALDASPPPTR